MTFIIKIIVLVTDNDDDDDGDDEKIFEEEEKESDLHYDDWVTNDSADQEDFGDYED